MKSIYVASSWRNPFFPEVVQRLREPGFHVFDFRQAPDGTPGFCWQNIDPAYQEWTRSQYLEALRHPAAQAGFKADYQAMLAADFGVLVLPCGRSAHLEAGFFCQPGKQLIILLDEGPPVAELMYNMAALVTTSLDEVIEYLCVESAAQPKPPIWAGTMATIGNRVIRQWKGQA